MIARRLCPSLLVFLVAPAASAATLDVGPGKTYAAPCAAIAAAQPGDTIAIDAAGTYSGDVCAISTNGLTIQGVAGRPKIDAGGKIAQSKGTWVVYGNDITIENVELFGAHSANGSSPSDQNGAGIRGQGTNLTVRNCFIHDNDNGILGGGATDAVGEVTIEGTEFAHNGFGDGFSHNVYINHVAKLTFRFNYSHDVAEGHLLKSRADTNIVLYNRLTGEGGTDSYEIDLPNGGIAYVIGNIVQQSATTHNPGIITFAEEGPHANGTPDHLFDVNNTIVNELGKGTFVVVGGGVTTPAVIANNIFDGTGTVCSQASAVLTTNFTADPKLANAAAFDYHLTAGSPCIDAGTSPGTGDGVDLTPAFEYVHPELDVARAVNGALDIGAYEFGNGSAGAGGSGQAGAGTAGSSGSNGIGGSSGSSSGGSSGKGGSSGGSSGKGGSSGGSGGKGGAAAMAGAAGTGDKAGAGAIGGASAAGGATGKGGAGQGGKGVAASGGTSAGGATAGASAASATPASGDTGGCGCRAATGSVGWGWLGVALGLGVLARRRRTESSRSL